MHNAKIRFKLESTSVLQIGTFRVTFYTVFIYFYFFQNMFFIQTNALIVYKRYVFSLFKKELILKVCQDIERFFK